MRNLLRPICFKTALLGILVIAAGPALAGGGIGNQLPDWVPGTDQVQQSRSSAAFNSGAGETTSVTGGQVSVDGPNGYSYDGAIVAYGLATNTPSLSESSAVMANSGAATAGDGTAPVAVISNNFSQSFSKGDFSISLGESELYTTVTINGRQYLVAREVAVALSRATPAGTSASTYVGSTVVDGGSYTGTQVLVSKSR